MPDAGRRMFHYAVPDDGRAHVIELWNTPVATAATRAVHGKPSVEFWAEHTDGGLTIAHAYQVFGTGDPLPKDAEWVATCPRTDEGLVFHLYEIPLTETERMIGG